MLLTLRCIQVTFFCFLDKQQYLFGVQTFARGRESVVDELGMIKPICCFNDRCSRSHQSILSYSVIDG